MPSSASRKVQKNNNGQTRRRRVVAVTIPELKHSFDRLEDAVPAILKIANPKQRVRKFQEVWRDIFGRPVEAYAAEAYLQVKSRDVAGARGKTRKTKKGSQKGSQKGGAGSAAPLAGAPLDFQTRPGVDGVHGSFPSYVSSGFSFYNNINKEAMFTDCGYQNITPKIAADMGSNQAGGANVFTDAIHNMFSRPISSSPVPSVAQDLQTQWHGRDLGASPAPEDNMLK